MHFKIKNHNNTSNQVRSHFLIPLCVGVFLYLVLSVKKKKRALRQIFGDGIDTNSYALVKTAGYAIS